MLLVDGYDEIADLQRQKVSKALREFAALSVGNFYLTCREYYTVHDVLASHFNISPFSREDSVAFIDAFSRAYGKPATGEYLLGEMEKKGLLSLAEHPLPLALLCILKSGPIPDLPSSPVRFLRRAVELLTIRWDYDKGVGRTSEIELDGEDRIWCLMAIAFSMEELSVATSVVETILRRYVTKKLRRTDIPITTLLDELAQWFGILVPTNDERWTFVHKSLHDFLAARYWVESATFRIDKITTWNSRVAYAAALMPDATDVLVAILQYDSISVFAEALVNRPVFERDVLVGAIVQHFHHFAHSYFVARRDQAIFVSTTSDFFAAADENLLLALAETGPSRRTNVRDMVTGYALAELAVRHVTLPPKLRQRLKVAYGGAITFFVKRGNGDIRVDPLTGA